MDSGPGGAYSWKDPRTGLFNITSLLHALWTRNLCNLWIPGTSKFSYLDLAEMQGGTFASWRWFKQLRRGFN
jgi:hypothetical protein